MAKTLKTVVALLVLFVLLAGGLFVAETVLRKRVPDIFAGHAREYLHLSDTHPVDVELNGIILLQLVKKSFDGVRIEIPDAPLKDQMRATLIAEAERMPLDPQKSELQGAQISAQFTPEQLGEVVRVFSKGIGQQVSIEADGIIVANSVSFFGQVFLIKISFTPEARDGDLHITPKGIDAAGLLNFTVDQLPNIPQLSKFSDGFDICIADKLPVGVTLEEVVLSTAQTMTVTVALADRIGIDESLQEFGTCE